nr:hypothetical protein [Tanacetum cinerariifolium]
EAQAVNQHLSLVERGEVHRLGIAEFDDAEQPVVGRVGHRHRVGELFRRIDAVAVADGHVLSVPRRLLGHGEARCGAHQQGGRAQDGPDHVSAP